MDPHLWFWTEFKTRHNANQFTSQSRKESDFVQLKQSKSGAPSKGHRFLRLRLQSETPGTHNFVTEMIGELRLRKHALSSA